MTAREKLAEGKKSKDEGAVKFKAGDLDGARELYLSAFEWVEHEYDFYSDEDKSAALEVRVACQLNAAQCSLKLKSWQETVTSCTKVLGYDNLAQPSKIKALFRRGSAYIKMAEFASARADLLEACKLDPKSKVIREAYASIKLAEAAANTADAGLFAKMVGAGWPSSH